MPRTSKKLTTPSAEAHSMTSCAVPAPAAQEGAERTAGSAKGRKGTKAGGTKAAPSRPRGRKAAAADRPANAPHQGPVAGTPVREDMDRRPYSGGQAQEDLARPTEALQLQLQSALADVERVRQELAAAVADVNQVQKTLQEGGKGLLADLEKVRREAAASRQELGTVRREIAEAESRLAALRREPAEGVAPAPAPVMTAPAATAAEEEAQALPAEPRNRLGVTVAPGVVVAEVTPDSPAASAGLARGDVIERVNDTPVVTGAELRDVIQGLAEGAEPTLHVTSGAVARNVTVKLDQGTTDEAAPAEGRNRLGLTVEAGVVVTEVLSGSPAEAGGLEEGDVIAGVNGTPVQSGEQLRQAVQGLPERAEVRLQVTRGKESREVGVRLDGHSQEQG